MSEHTPHRRLEDGEVLRGDELSGFGGDVHFDAEIGLVIDELSLERCVGHLDCGPQHQQPYGIVHGGVWCSVIESLASTGAAMHAGQQEKVVVGVNNSTDFLRAHRTGRVTAVAAPVHVGRSQQLWQVVLTRETDGKVVARGQVRLQNIVADQLP